MGKNKEKLKRITEVLLRQEDEYGLIKDATDDLYELFIEISKLNEEEEATRKDYFLPKGKAIGTVWAGRCVKEFMRTQRFIAGIHKAIRQAQDTFKDTPIHILYAGTGPFGTLLIPLTTIFTSEEIKITFLDINADSLEILKIIIKEFGLEDYVEGIVLCDATEYKSDNKPIHMVVTETMQNALKKEPQVAITGNLVPQLVEGGILIPQNITINAVLLDSKRDMERMMGVEGADKDYSYPLDTIFELNKDSILEAGKENFMFKEVQVEIPQNIEERYNRLHLLTQIQVFEEEHLTYMQCSLNMPVKIMDMDWKNNNVKKVNFQYIVNETPGFVHTIS